MKPTPIEVKYRAPSLSVFLTVLAIMGLVQFYGSAAFAAPSCSQVFADSSKAISNLPSGRAIDFKAYSAEPEAMALYNVFFQKSKQAHLTGTGGMALGSVYSHVEYLNSTLRLLQPTHPLHKLSELELASLVEYSEWGYQNVNTYLWNPKKAQLSAEESKMAEARILMIVSALNKLPTYKGIVYRGDFISFQSAFKEAHKYYDSLPEVGGIHTFLGFTSTTEGKSPASRKEYIENAALSYVIKSKSGRSIKDASTRKNEEEEVLFLPQSKFRVIKKERVPVEPTDEYPFTERFVIHLEEI
ncbi:ADP-ribosyltransferase [Bdellovibrio sp. HCB337]|uniref:ADP-ribosyltransferase n=1 Tax=Bdellovibrio sp. HCB337 TaxID=3394358 RepID=UPI0039A67848